MPEFKNEKIYDLEERTAIFAENVILLCKGIVENTITRPIISQLIRAATSIGANYLETNGASSKKDFANKIYIYKKESQESRHWLRMLATCYPDKKNTIAKLWKEAHELSMIFHKISKSTRADLFLNFKLCFLFLN